MTGHDKKRSFWPASYRSFLFISTIVLLSSAPWFYGLTRLRDQLVAELLIFSFFLISVPVFNWDRILDQGTHLRETADRWVLSALLLSFLYVLISSLPYQSLLAFFRFLSVVLFYFLIRDFVDTKKKFHIFLWGIVILGTVYAVYGLAQYYGFLPHPYWRGKYELASRYVNGGHFAAFLVFPFFGAASLLAAERNVSAKASLGMMLCLQGWALLLTRSRTIWLSLLVGVGVLIYLMKRQRLLSGKIVVGLLLLAAVSGTFFWSLGFLDPVIHRIESLWKSNFFSLFHRWHMWEGSLRAVVSRPWGWGLGTFGEILPQFRTHSDRFLIDYAHNEFLQVGVDLGIPGILFLTGFIVFFLRRFALLRASHPSSVEPVIALGFFATGVSLFLASQADFPIRIYATGLLFAAYLGLTVFLFETRKERRQEEAFVQPAGRSRNSKSLVIRWIGVFIILAAGCFVARQLFAEIHFERGFKLEKDFSWEGAHGEYQRSISWAPFYVAPHVAQGDLYRKRASLAMNRDQKQEYRRRAIEAFQRAASLQSRGAGRIHYVLGLLFNEIGDIKQSRFHLEAAVHQAPMNAIFVSEYGYQALEWGDQERAIELFEQFQKIRFQESTHADPCEILRRFSKHTQKYQDLRRVVDDRLEDHLCLGYVLGEVGEWDFSRAEFDAALLRSQSRYGPNAAMKNTGEAIARFYVLHERLQDALGIYEEALKHDPENTDYRKELISISGQLGRAAGQGDAA
ncbi:MAG: O-antigen ligase family protein [Candidatus Omnitrophica bacterium]|nr:O-antigen ligase family protein [Candidatus Omnitrophota bacterium]